MPASLNVDETLEWKWRSVDELEPEVAGVVWRLVPRLLQERATSRTLWCVYIQHGHIAEAGAPNEWEHCGLSNREATQRGEEEPAYQCNGCGTPAPATICSQKWMRQKELRLVDPRNNRRAAVLATRKRRGQNESRFRLPY